MKTFSMRLSGHINGFKLSYEGSGRRVSELGYVEGTYRSVMDIVSTSSPPKFDHWLFNCLIITGYPSETNCIDGASNPFFESPYSYCRKINFFERGQLTLNTNVSFKGDDLVSSFDVAGEIDLPRLNGVRPTVETWVPISEKTVLGTFTMAWRTENELEVPAHATTTYNLAEDRSLPSTQYRWIEIEAEGDLESFVRRQKSTSFLERSFFPQ